MIQLMDKVRVIKDAGPLTGEFIVMSITTNAKNEVIDVEIIPTADNPSEAGQFRTLTANVQIDQLEKVVE